MEFARVLNNSVLENQGQFWDNVTRMVCFA